MQSESTDVVIIGAGPCGLMLAIELKLGGASVVVLDRLVKPDETIKAGAIGALAGEALERRGLGPAMDAEEQKMAEAMQQMVKRTGAAPGALPDLAAMRRIGGHFAGLFLIDQTRQREPERRLRAVRQAPLERMLADRAAGLGIEVRRGYDATSIRNGESGVAVTGQGPQGSFAIEAAWLVGCDGGRSMVRKSQGFDFPGTEPTLTGHQAVVELDHPERLLPLGWRRTPTGMMAYGPLPGRIFLAEFDGPPADRDAPVTRDELEGSLRHVSGADVRITAVQSATRFTDNARQAADYRKGRILLAGDAAHVHSPFGGQGLNLGLLDAVNLGWKLAAVVAGDMPDALLDTYTTERHPIAARVLANTRAQVALMQPNVLTTALRDIVTEIMALDEGNRYFGELISGIATRYDLGDDNAAVGRLAADRPVIHDSYETTLYRLMQDGRGVVLDDGRGAAHFAAAGWRDRLTLAESLDGSAMLVRPDGCIAWASGDGNAAGLAFALNRWFGEAAASDQLQPAHRGVA